jgi:hypothetical protein
MAYAAQPSVGSTAQRGVEQRSTAERSELERKLWDMAMCCVAKRGSATQSSVA